MRKVSKGTVITAAVLTVALILGIVTAAAPSADKERKEAEYLTELSTKQWIHQDVYSGGQRMEHISLNGQPTEGSFAFGLNDTISFVLPDSPDENCRIGFAYHVTEASPMDTLFEISYQDNTVTAYLPILWKDDIAGEGRYATDRYGNELSNTQTFVSDTIFQALLDNTDIDKEELSLPLSGRSISIKNTTQEIILDEIWLYRETPAKTYQEYQKANESRSDSAEGMVTIQGEDFSIKSDSYIRSANVNNPELTPYNTYHRMINTLDGTSFDEAGQKVMWEFEVDQDGWYELGLKFTQNSAVNKTVYRRFELDGRVPFEEMEQVPFAQTGNLSYETVFLTDEQGENYRFYLTAGRHTLAMTAKMGPIKEIYNELLSLTDAMNALGMDITKLTAGVEDKNRTWDLNAYLPNAVGDIQSYIDTLQRLYDALEKMEGQKPAYADSLLYAKQVLEQLLKKPRTIPNNLDLFNTGDNSAVKHISTVINNMISLSLGVDEIYIKAENQEFAAGSVSFATKIANSIKKFAYSLNPEATQSTSGTKGDDDTLKVWMSRSSVYVQVLQSMADSAQELEGMKVDISIMPSEQKLVLAAAADTNPDVVLGATYGTPYKFAIRGAAKDLTEYEDFLSFYDSQYHLENLVPCAYDQGVYGAVETQDFNVLFYRKDILKALDIPVPETWDDVKAVMPTLLRYNKNFSLPIANVVGFKSLAATTPWIYQRDGQLYTPDGSAAALREQDTLDGMRELTELFKVYAVDDYVASFYNSFRNGDTPLGIGGVSMYVQMTEAAPELAGMWDIAPIPGTKAQDGSIERNMNAAMTTAMIFKNTKHSEESWRFLKWWLSKETQAEFASTIEMSYGTEYRWNTANLEAFEAGSYPKNHKGVIREVWEDQQENLQHPASYIVERELSNAFTNVVVNGDTVVEAMESSTLISDREILRKLKEFGYADSDGNMKRDYNMKIIEMIQEKLKAQKGGGDR